MFPLYNGSCKQDAKVVAMGNNGIEVEEMGFSVVIKADSA
jgi:hypothetical protein